MASLFKTRAGAPSAGGAASRTVPDAEATPVPTNMERYLLAERFTRATYIAPFAFWVKGLDPERMSRAFNETVAAHRILRTDFAASRGGFVGTPARELPRLTEYDWRGLDPEAVRTRLIETIFVKPVDLTAVNFVKTICARIGPDEHVVVFALNHAVTDGVSMPLYIKEIADRYNGKAPALPIHDYWDVASHPPAGVEPEVAQAYWREQLAGLDDLPELPNDLSAEIPIGKQQPVRVPLALSMFEALAQRYGVTPFVVAAALSHVIIGRFTGSDRSVLTFQSSGRKPYPNSAGVMGPFSNSIVLAGRVAADKSFAQLVSEQRTATSDAIKHETYPYHLIVRDTGVQPHFGINWYPKLTTLELEGAETSAADELLRQTNYDLDFRFVRKPSGLELIAWHDNGRYSRDRIEAICTELKGALERLAADPELTIGAMFPKPAPLTVAPPTAVPKARLFDAFLAQAAADPNRIALLGEDWRMTYGEVDAASAALGRRLVAAGLGPGKRIGIVAERGPQLVWTFIAVLRIGATAVPLDASYPEDRLATLLSVARPEAIVLPKAGPIPGWALAAPQVIAAQNESAPAVPEPAIPAEALAAGDPDAPAYILFTSGSTGTPKGIATSHRPPQNFLAWQRKTFGITADDRFTNLNGVAHDMMIRDIFQPLSIGAQLAIPQQDDIFKPGRLLEWLEHVQPTVTHMTPAMGQLLCMAARDGQTLPLRAIFFGGDRLLPELTRKLAKLAPGATLVNFYGATETPQAAAFHVVDPQAQWATHPIGRGIENMELRIVDAEREPAPAGAPGEIAVVTPFLSLGYVKDGTIEPHARPGIYFTGDTGFELPSGEIFFGGRTDDQISIRGYRIELEEINGALRAQPGVKSAVALPYGPVENRRIAAFIVPECDSTSLKKDVLTALSVRLPSYMMPHLLHVMDKLPLLPNGKLDRRALQGLADQLQEEAARPTEPTSGAKPKTDAEKAIVKAWAEILGRGDISVDDSFQELSGDSLSYVQAYLAVEQVVGAVPEGWQFRSIRELAGGTATAPRWGRVVDMALAVRAFAITAVVGWHFGLVDYDRGVTSSLYLISGLLFGSFALVETFRLQNPRPVINQLGRLLLPVMVFTFAIFAMRTAGGNDTHPAFLLLYENWFEYGAMTREEAARHEMVMWFIHCSVQMLLILAGILYLLKDRLGTQIDRFRFVAGVFLAGCVTRFVMPIALVPGWLAGEARPLNAVTYLPTTHLPTFMLGCLLATSRTPGQRRFTAAALLLYVAATIHFLNSSSWIFILIGGVLLLLKPQVRLPKLLAQIVFLVSGASLFIYLSHVRLLYIFRKTELQDYPLVGALLAIVLGVVIWKVWQLLYNAFWKTRAKDDSEEAAAVSV